MWGHCDVLSERERIIVVGVIFWSMVQFQTRSRHTGVVAVVCRVGEAVQGTWKGDARLISDSG